MSDTLVSEERRMHTSVILLWFVLQVSAQFSLEDLAKHARTKWILAKREETRLTTKLKPFQIDPNAPNPPTLPNIFKAKGKVSVAYNFDTLSTPTRELLAIYHYNYPEKKTRLDVYFINQNNITRYFTTIKNYKKMVKYMIFHRIHGNDIPLKSPHSCLIVPLKNAMLHPRIVHERGRFMGIQNTTIGSKSKDRRKKEDSGGSVRDIIVPTYQWEIEEDNEDSATTWHYYTSVTENKPIRLVRHEKNVDIHFLDFQEENPIDIFVPEKVSKVKCAPYRGRHGGIGGGFRL